MLENQSLKQTVLKNTLWLTIGNGTSKIIRAILIIYAARILGTDGYGIFSYALSVAAFFTVFSDIGLSSLLTREVARGEKKDFRPYVSTTFVVKLILLAITILITVFIAPYFTKVLEARPLIPLVALLLVFDSLRGFGFSFTRAQNKMELEAGLSMATDTFITIFGLIVLFTQPTTTALTFAYIAGSGIGFVMVFWAIRRQLRGVFSHFDKKLIKPILTSAWPFAVMGLLGGFMINIDTIIIGIFKDAYNLGLYAAAQRPVQMLYMIPALFATALFPIMSKLAHSKNLEKLKQIIEKSTAIVLALGVPLVVGGIALGKPLIKLLFGAGYEGAIIPFQLLLVTILFVFPGTVIGNAVFAYDKQKIFILSTGLGALANTGLDLLLIPTYGIIGCAFATIFSQFIVNWINWREMKKITGFRPIRLLSRTLIATAIMAVFVIIMNSFGLHIIPNIILSSVIYLGVIFFLKDPLLDFIKISGLIK